MRAAFFFGKGLKLFRIRFGHLPHQHKQFNGEKRGHLAAINIRWIILYIRWIIVMGCRVFAIKL